MHAFWQHIKCKNVFSWLQTFFSLFCISMISVTSRVNCQNLRIILNCFGNNNPKRGKKEVSRTWNQIGNCQLPGTEEGRKKEKRKVRRKNETHFLLGIIFVFFKILWIVNIILYPLCNKLPGTAEPGGSAGANFKQK